MPLAVVLGLQNFDTGTIMLQNNKILEYTPRRRVLYRVCPVLVAAAPTLLLLLLLLLLLVLLQRFTRYALSLPRMRLGFTQWSALLYT
jgi:hypothetical protein